jgi:signal transduction histidine kinase/ligand-binding sensor domain-containing protein/DNA-binding response OmpR family regulator
MRDPTRYCIFLLFLLLILSHQTTSQTHILTEQKTYDQFNPPVFEDITIEDGLPENSVTCILQDYLGYIWLGTQNGLVQYDGYSMKVFQPEKDNSSSISDGRIVTIYEDKNKTLWIGTLNGGINKFNRTDESFRSYRYDPDDTTSINSDKTHCIYEDKSGRLWIGTFDGLNLIDREKGNFIRYYLRIGDIRPNSKTLLKINPRDLSIDAITEDPESGDLLIGTEIYGLWKFDVKEKIFSKYKFSSDDNFDKKIGLIQSFYKARDGKIWIASFHTLSRLDPQKRTLKSYIDFPIIWDESWIPLNYTFAGIIEDQKGLIWCGFIKGEKCVFCLNPVNESVQQYNLFPEKPKNVNENNVLTLCEDRSGILWIGTWTSGLMKLDRGKNKFQLLKYDFNNFSNSLSHSIVYCAIYDPKGFVWFCTPRALDKYDIISGTYEHYFEDENCVTKSVYTALQDKSGYIWFGTSSCGLIRFSPGDESYRFYFNDPNESVNLVNKQITYLLQDHIGILWIGTMGFGLYKFDKTNNIVTHFREDPNDTSNLSQDEINVIFEDRLGTLWVGTNYGGLNKFDRKTEKFSHCGFKTINSIYEDEMGKLWVGDFYVGLNLYDREKGAIINSYNQKDGLASNYILGILEDNHNNLWISTQNGLSKFNTTTRTFRNYFKEDGLPDLFTLRSNCAKSSDGKMYFNTNGGEILFHPDSIKDDPTPPQVVLSGISLFNRPGEKLSYEGFISELKKITLPYDQNDLRFDFVGLHFSEPARNKYKYILENFDDDWVNAGTQRNATYTNLSPGEYVFRVTASNKDGVWNTTGTSIKIIILPPWWKTWWAYLLYTLVIISVFIVSTRFYLNRQRLRQKLVLESEHAEKLEELAKMKSDFFANISHEFRTPLTLILGPAEKIKKNESANPVKDADIIARNSNRLLQLVNQLLDLSKLDAGKLKLEASPGNIISFLKGIALSFESLSEARDVMIKLKSDKEFIEVYFDREKMVKVFSNLLSNAFKFTPERGNVVITIVQKSNNIVEIRIRNTGIGIPQKELPKLFDRFYQVDSSQTKEYEGTGIGLALVKELIELHHGSISVASKESNPEEKEKGWTEFTISLPLGRAHLKDEEISIADKETHKEETPVEAPEYLSPRTIIESEAKQDETKTTILVVEDNYDMREYIKESLSDTYAVEEAVNGEQGVRIAETIIPDLIISDLMMPKMDGNELTRILKNDERTSHIPIILLTAKSGQENKIEGLQTGADDYLTKPFDLKELRVRVENLISVRRKLQEKFSKGEFLSKPVEKKLKSIDERFLAKVLEVIEKHISEEEFSIEECSSEVGLSRTHFHKKLRALVGKSPSQYVRTVRLYRAKQMIEEEKGNVSEVAYSVGFSSPAYFSRCFKEEFGYTPKNLIV